MGLFWGSDTASGVGARFAAAVDGMPDLGQGRGWTPADWRRAPREQVPVSRLVATNRRGYLDEARVARYARGGGGGDIYVVAHGGRYWIADGHHRAAAAMVRGRAKVTARVLRPRDARS